ncbi:MAG: calcium-binding protein, partial [Methylotenera sp.]|nr:calcium-binding protein [Methylotenera sp.]
NNDNMIGSAGDDYISAGTGNDVVTGSAGNDTIIGGSGYDVLAGGAGNDTFLIDGTDTAYDRFDGGDGYDVIQGGAGDDTIRVNLFSGTNTVEKIDGGAGQNILAGSVNNDSIDLSNTELVNIALIDAGTGNDVVTGSAGNDLIQGKDGADRLTDTQGNNLLDAGAGVDVLIAGTGNDLLIGGLGNDTITTGTGYDVIVFNKGDGQDIINASTGDDNTLSLGGNFAYSDLSLTKSTNNLILKMGATDQITLKDWYLGTTNKSVVNLQVIAEAIQGFSLGSADNLRNNKIESFNFTNLVAAFDAAGATASWQLTDARLTTHLQSGSDTAAIGGDLAYQYGKNSNLAGMGSLNAQSVIAAASFGQTAQTLNNPTVWQAELVKLG